MNSDSLYDFDTDEQRDEIIQGISDIYDAVFENVEDWLVCGEYIKTAKEIIEEVDENDEYNIHLNEDTVNEVAEYLSRQGYNVEWPGDEETHNGINFVTISITKGK
jgi:hypothetical protein